jgi:hypothetical protein
MSHDLWEVAREACSEYLSETLEREPTEREIDEAFESFFIDYSSARADFLYDQMKEEGRT